MPIATFKIEYDTDTHEVIVVEKQLAPLVHDLLTDAKRGPRAPVVPLFDRQITGPETVHVEDQGLWSEDMVRTLSQATTSTTLLGALDVIAQAAPEVVTYDKLLEATSAAQNKLRAELAVLSKLTKRLFGRRTWPMTARQGFGGGALMGYRMHHTVAGWWLTAREATPDGAKSPA